MCWQTLHQHRFGRIKTATYTFSQTICTSETVQTNFFLSFFVYSLAVIVISIFWCSVIVENSMSCVITGNKISGFVRHVRFRAFFFLFFKSTFSTWSRYKVSLSILIFHYYYYYYARARSIGISAFHFYDIKKRLEREREREWSKSRKRTRIWMIIYLPK